VSSETWLVLGASSTVARAFARAAAARGAQLLLAGRDVEDIETSARDLAIRSNVRAEALAFDATAYDRHRHFAEACRAKANGRLNVFLAFAIMPAQNRIDGDFALARATIEVNYLGAVSILQALAPILEAQRGGRVVVLGSCAGDRGRLANYLYGSTKAGLHLYVEGLRARLFRSGVTVTLIKPGPLDTAMTWGKPVAFPASPESCGHHCLAAAYNGVEVAYFPSVWRLIMTIVRHLPTRLLKHIHL
jgi:decaprenylphospho-beta-D-erythro-pentofuranosid-2-ulose 2-reductase